MPKIIACLIMVFLLFGCAGSARNRDQGQVSMDAAYDALSGMDRALGGEPLGVPSAALPPSAQGSAAAPLPGTQNTQQQAQPPSMNSQNKPAWVDSPDTVYSRQRYVSAVGYGTDRRQAERSALANLTGVFGQSIQAELKTVSTYQEAVTSGTIQITENASVQDAITTSVELDSLMGAEIADVWADSRNMYYAVAVMERARSAILYTDLIRSNERIIESLTSMTDAQKNTLNGYSRYVLAATIADANRVYANVLTVLGNTSGINPATMRRGDDYRIVASEIARNIPIAVNVDGDRSGRIRNAFSRSLSAAGFRSGGNDSRYALNAALIMNDADLPGQQNVFVRFIVDVNLVDTTDNSVIFPFSFNGREGHINRAEAEERVLRVAENRIADEYGKELRDYLSILLPK